MTRHYDAVYDAWQRPNVIKPAKFPNERHNPRSGGHLRGTDFFVKFSTLLIDLRNRAGLTQTQLAELAHIDQATISKYESNKRVPELEAREKLRDALATLIGPDAASALTTTKTTGKSEHLSSVDRHSTDRAKDGAGARPTALELPVGSEARTMWERNQALERALADQVIENQSLRDLVANLQETIRGHVAKENSAAKVKASPKPGGPTK